MSWVTKITAKPNCCCSSLTWTISERWATTSSAEVGSSMMIRSGVNSIAIPIIRSTSAERAAISCFDRTPCARITSENCAPIDLTGFSAFIADCMTTDRSFHRIAASSLSVSPTMFVPRKATLPPAMPAGGASSWAIANSSVDLPQPDSPTTPRNSPGPRSKLTWSTAVTVPRSITYSTVRSRTASTGCPAASGTGAAPAGGKEAAAGEPARLASLPEPSAGPALSLPGTLDTGTPPHGPDRAQRRVADLVERVVDQRERRAQGHDAQAGNDDPQWRDLECLRLLGPVEHRAPARHVRVAEPEELEAGGEQHRIQRVGQEAGDQQRCHRRDDLDHDDVEPPLAAHARGLQVVAASQGQRLGTELAGGVGPAGGGDDNDHDCRAGALEIAADDDQQRQQRDDQQHVGDHVEHAVVDSAEVGGRDADQHGDDGGAEAHSEGDQQHRPGAVNHLGEHVLAECGGAEPVA